MANIPDSIISVLVVSFFIVPVNYGQVTPTASKDMLTPAIIQVREAIRKVLDDSGKSFKEGMVALKANRRAEAGSAFDKSVETFLFSTLDIQRDPSLQGCYGQLIETIYRIEHPSSNQPQIRSLSATCGWRWATADMQLADEIVAIARPSGVSSLADVPQAVSVIALPNPNTGFNEQGFEPSPLDELGKLELTDEELTVESYRLSSSSRIVRAQAGDTVAKVATRNGADPNEVAKYNGLLPNSSLGAGREIKLPRYGEKPTARVNTITYARPFVCSGNPTVQKLRLGMSVNETAIALRAKVVAQRKRYAFFEGTSEAIVRSISGTKAIFLSFYEGRLYRIAVYYDNSIKWNGIAEFEAAVSKSLNLPQTWRTDALTSQRELLCKDFELQVSEYTRGHFSLRIDDMDVYNQMFKARALRQEKLMREQEKRKQAFKP